MHFIFLKEGGCQVETVGYVRSRLQSEYFSYTIAGIKNYKAGCVKLQSESSV